MAACCGRPRDLWLFAVGVIAGLRAGSSALLGDSVDMFADDAVWRVAGQVPPSSQRY
jgi:hypothetical protein